MTIEKAMKILRAVDGIECRFQGYTTALGIAMFALEKQLPKKVTKNGYGVSFCPVCRGSVWQNRDESKYCFRCGQVLDWSDENE